MTLRTDAAAASIDYPLSAKATAPNIIKLDEEVFTQGGSKHPSEKTEEENLVASEDVGNEAAMEAVGRLIDEESLRAVGVIPQKPLYYRFIKRVFDIVFSTCVIIAGFIPGLILSAFIAKDTGGSPIYSSVRVAWSIIGQKSGAASGCASRPALSALRALNSRHPLMQVGVAA